MITLLTAVAGAQQASTTRGVAAINEPDLKTWLTYLSSDELQGRATYTEGLGLAAGYIAAHLQQWGVKPAGDNGTYLQTVRVLGIRANSKASITVDVNGQTRTFKDGEGVTFPRQMGGKQTIDGSEIAFVGYGLEVPAAEIDDYGDLAAKGKVILYLGPQGPATLPQGSGRLLTARARNAFDKGAAAVITASVARGGGRGATPAAVAPAPAAGATPATPTTAGAPAAPVTPPAQPAGGRGFGPPQVDNGDFTTVQRYDAITPPQVTAQDEFLEFLFSGAEVKYADLKEKAAKREPLPRFLLKGVKMTINVDADYQVVRTRLTHNVVGIIEGSDPKLKDTYVAYGAHYDHTGFRESAKPGEDMINNGADDDGSGTVAIMAIAKAFATGPKPKRSILLVWHAGEENGLLGSEYMADHPVGGDINKIVTQLNMDMVGRNQNDDAANSNMVLIVGSDRISTELHNINEEANAALAKPLSLDYTMNDPADRESIYTRSDHYSYASKGVPIVFYFTGLHPDYHRPSDTVDKIIFDKIQRIAHLAYETGRRVANSDKAPAKDNLGPRAGKGHKGRLPTADKSVGK
ncbi:MAG TPA: M28 family peptidase [Vicinamibacterales bacterium]|nr:M28 family peptidase [Vicinamibacterales bacterium]